MLDKARRRVMPSVIQLGVVQAAGLRKADMLGKSDPYCTIKWRGLDAGTTEVAPKTLDPMWDEEFSLDLPWAEHDQVGTAVG